MSETPRTDAERIVRARVKGWLTPNRVVRIEFARELERELAAAVAAKEQAERERDAIVHDVCIRLCPQDAPCLVAAGV